MFCFASADFWRTLELVLACEFVVRNEVKRFKDIGVLCSLNDGQGQECQHGPREKYDERGMLKRTFLFALLLDEPSVVCTVSLEAHTHTPSMA